MYFAMHEGEPPTGDFHPHPHAHAGRTLWIPGLAVLARNDGCAVYPLIFTVVVC
jgi:hypothetical protein